MLLAGNCRPLIALVGTARCMLQFANFTNAAGRMNWPATNFVTTNLRIYRCNSRLRSRLPSIVARELARDLLNRDPTACPKDVQHEGEEHGSSLRSRRCHNDRLPYFI